MAKRLTISDGDYYILFGLKSKHQTDSIEEIIRLEGIKPPNHTTTKPETKQELCACGHPKEAHEDDGCMANGGVCECASYRETP